MSNASYERSPAPLPLGDDQDDAGERISIWLGTIEQVRRHVGPDRYHARLSIESFAVVPGKSGETRFEVRLVDPEMIRPLETDDARSPSDRWSLAAPEQTPMVYAPLASSTNVFNLAALGVLLLGGELPWRMETSEVRKSVDEKRPFPLPLLRGYSSPVQQRAITVLDRALAFGTTDRYADVSTLELEVRLLKRMIDGSQVVGSLGLVGREAQRDRIARAITAARDGTPSHFAIIGETGVGKTFLWQSIAEAEKRSREIWIYTKAPHTGGRPYSAIASVLRHLSRDIEGEAAAEHLRSHGVTGLGLYLVSMLVPHLDIVDRKSDVRPQGMSRQQYESESARELTRAIVALSTRAELVVICFDDFQWIDPYTRRVVDQLTAVPRTRLCLGVLARPGSDLVLPDDTHFDRLELDGLSDSESRWLVDEALGGDSENDGPPVESLIALARGNPLALIQLVHAVRLSGRRSLNRLSSTAAAHRTELLLESLAEQQLAALPSDARTLIELVSLLLPPVPERLVRKVEHLLGRDYPEPVATAAAAGLLSVDVADGTVSFTHDSIESAVYASASANSSVRALASSVLIEESEAGNEHAAYALARSMADADNRGREPGTPTAEHLSHDELSIAQQRDALRRAAQYAIRFGMAQEAKVFAEASLRRRGGSPDEEGETRLLAHEASYLLDDPRGMSHHFRNIEIHRHRMLSVRARELWVRRCYANAWFRGAIQTGSLALKQLGVIDDAAAWRKPDSTFARVLRHTTPRTLLRRLEKRGRTENETVKLAIRICHRMMLPILTIEPSALHSLAGLAFQLCLNHGWTEEAAYAYLYWLLAESVSDPGGARLSEFGDCALSLARRSGSETTRHEVETYVAAMVGVWTQPAAKIVPSLMMFADQGMQLGNRESAVHAWHIQCQAQFYSGVELSRVRRLFHDRRLDILDLNFKRSARALEKFEQSVESLMGLTPDPKRIEGDICREAEYAASIQESADALSWASFHMLKGMLAIYDYDPRLAQEWLDRAATMEDAFGPLYERAISVFLYGFVCFWNNQSKAGEAAYRRVRRWAREVPENHRHRSEGLRAERLRSKSRPRRAVRAYRRAVDLALKASAVHEGALFSERCGDILLSLGEGGQAAAEFHRAESLYRRWGAMPSVRRVRERLNWSDDLPLEGQGILPCSRLENILRAATVEDALTRALEHAAELSDAIEGFIGYRRVGYGEWFQTERGNGSSETFRTDFAQEKDVPLDYRFEIDAANERFDIKPIERGPDAAAASVAVVRVPFGGECSIGVCLVFSSGPRRFSDEALSWLNAVAMAATARVEALVTVEMSRDEEVRLKHAERELSKTEEHRRLLFGALSEGLILMNRDGMVLSANDAGEQYLVHRPTGRLYLDPTIQRAAVEVSEEGHELPDWKAETVDWCTQRLEVSAATTRTSDDTAMVAVSIRDVTELKQKEQALHDTERQLVVADRLASIGMFSSAFAHEIGNPNHILKLNTQSALTLFDRVDESGLEDETIGRIRSLVEQVGDAAERIDSVLNMLRSYARDGRHEDWRFVDADEVVNRAFRFCRIMAAEYTDNYQLSLSGGSTLLHAEPALLEQAIVNLIKNACEALEARESVVNVSVEHEESTSEIIIGVSDTGRGLPHDLRSRASEPFVTAGTDANMGLGLSIVQSIVERHRGILSFADRSGYSTTVEIKLPVGCNSPQET